MILHLKHWDELRECFALYSLEQDKNAA
jgi:hypothetical protein